MMPNLPQAEPCRLVSSDPALAAHSRRVAAMALEIARNLPLPRPSLAMLDQSARLHHASQVTQPSPLDRLLRDLSIATAKVRAGTLSRERTIALWAFHGIVSREPDPTIRKLAELLTLSDLLDEQMELDLLEPKTMPVIWRELGELRGMFSTAVLEAAQKAFPGISNTPASREWQVPVQAATASELVRGLAWSEHDYESLVAVAGRDPTLAGHLIRAANSALYGRTNPVRTIPEAVGFLGTEDTRKLMMALALRPLFASAGLLAVWKHSLAISRFCQGLASATSGLPYEEALLLGLMHDVGRLALHHQNRQHMEATARLVEAGCPPTYVEQLLFGKGHAEIGAELLASWRFPEDMVEAVRQHHRPANSSSPGAAALYLAEFWSETDEDLPSIRHLASAFSVLGCSMEILGKITRFQGPLAALMAA